MKRLFFGPRRLATCDPDGRVVEIERPALLAEGEFLTAVGTKSELIPAHPDAELVEISGGLITPGLVDAHTHLPFVGSRADEFEMRALGATYQDIARQGGGIQSTVRAVQQASDADLHAATEHHSRWLLACGTTTAEAKSGYGLSQEHELRQLMALERQAKHGPLRLHATFLALHAVPADMAVEEFVEVAIERTLPSVAESQLASAVDAFVEDGYFAPEHARQLAFRAREFGLGLHLHVDQFGDHGGAALAATLGAYSADHLEYTTPDGIHTLAQAGVVPVLLPGSVLSLGRSQYPDARAMLNAGLPVALATDFNPGSSPTPSLPFIMSLAVAMMGMTPQEAFAGVTLHAAQALRDHEVGILVPGRRADFVVWDVEDYRELAIWIGAPIVTHVVVGGHEITGLGTER